MLDKLMTPQTVKLGRAFDMAGFEVRFVGGCVRDALLGVEPKDVDFCTDATPDEMRDVAEINGFGFVPTGVQHGTVTLLVDGEPFEVTTLRVDVETDGRRAEVEFTRSFEVDAERRDLTFNAMSMDFKGVVYDYWGGKEDLKNRVVRFVGVDRLRVQEDYLRILRYFRFAARFDATMDETTLEMFSETEVLDGLYKVSVERFWQEMSKMLDPSMPARTRVVDAMFKCRVNRAVDLYRFQPVELTRSPDSVTALSTLVAASDLKAFLGKWKLSSEEAAKVTMLVTNREVEVSKEWVEDQLVSGVNRDWVVSLLTMRGEDALAQFAATWDVPAFPVRGQDLLDSGMEPGREVGQRLARMKVQWTESRFTASRDQLMKVE